mmetsp:Transcript_17103/g.53393  ORF Transcript_17103/g.53393 Transcript_17103/m.53393 type:complete len:423 (+) Transcript_17103:202-1470(+)
MAPRGVAFVAFAALAAATAPRSSPKPSDDAELEEPKMKKMSAYLYYSQQNRPAAKQAVDEDPENAEMGAGDKNRAVVKKLGAMWKALEKADQEKWKEDAPMVEVKPKKPKAKKSEGGGAAAAADKPKKATGKLADKEGLEAKMEADGWVKEEKERANGTGVDKSFIPPDGKGKKQRSLLAVARAAYPEFLTDEAASPAPKKKPAAKKAKADKPAGKGIADFYPTANQGGLRDAAEYEKDAAAAAADDGDEEMADGGEGEKDDGDDEMAEAAAAPPPPPKEGDLSSELKKGDEIVFRPEARPKEDEVEVIDDGGAAAKAEGDAFKQKEKELDEAEKDSDDPRAREAYAYRQKNVENINKVSVNDVPDDTEDAEAKALKQKEKMRKEFISAHPPLTKQDANIAAGEEADTSGVLESAAAMDESA